MPFGVARIARAGTDITIVAAGQIVQRALEAAETLAARGHRLRGHRSPHHHAARRRDRSSQASRKTHRLLIVDEGWAMCGVGAELGQAMNELAFDELDAPVGRLHTEPTSHPLRAGRSSARCWSTPARIAAGRARRHRRPPAGARALVHGRHQERRAGQAGACAGQAAARGAGAPRPSCRATASRSPCRSATSPSAKARSCAG